MVHFSNPRTRHPFHMHDMIRGQPAFVEEALERTGGADLGPFVGRSRELIVTGCGTSFHAAAYGARVLQEAVGSRGVVRAVHAYDLAYGLRPSRGATVLGVRERETDRTWVIGSTHDRSWANTMSYTMQLAVFAALAARLGGPEWSGVRRGLRALPHSLETALECEVSIREIARGVARRDRVTFLGSGLDAITALEAALKIRETCSLPASGYHMEQLLHGPCLSVDRRESVVMLRSRDDGARAEAIRKSMMRFGALVTTIGEASDAEIRLPSTERFLRPIVSIVPLQFLAYYSALERRANPDIMRTDIPRYRAGLRDAVPVRDLLGRQLLLVEGDQDAEGVVVEEGLSVLVIEQKFFGQQLRSGGFAAVRWRSERHAADSGSLD